MSYYLKTLNHALFNKQNAASMQKSHDYDMEKSTTLHYSRALERLEISESP